MTSETNRRGQTLSYMYDAQKRVTQERFADNSTVTYGYDSSTGIINSVTDSRGTKTFNYNETTRQFTINYGGGRSVSYQFDSEGQRTQLVRTEN
jgi:YD repeat-containing protein